MLSERMDRPLARGERWRLWLHLRLCDMCSRFASQMDFLRSAMRRLGE
ncbi:MAG TPA: anti-sigma factor [Burkholderiaceae bacterium]|nr:anti-sigma factor [Burkholderiaceae bacterium]